MQFFKHNLIWIRFLKILLLITCYSAQGANLKAQGSVTVNIFIEDKSLYPGATIKISLVNGGINSVYFNDTKTFSKAVSSSKTQFKLPVTNNVNYGVIEFNSQALSTRPISENPLCPENNLFIFQPGDIVNLHIKNLKNGIWFSGKSAPKYNCLYRISNHRLFSFTWDIGKSSKDEDIEKAFSNIERECDSLYMVRSKILKSFSYKVDPEIYKLEQIDIWAEYNQQLMNFLYRSAFIMKKTNLIPVAKRVFLKRFSNFNDQFYLDTDLMVRSYKYCDFLLEKVKANIVVLNSSNDSSYYPKLNFGDIYRRLQAIFPNGILKDKITLLSFSNLDRRRQQDYVNYIDDAIKNSDSDIFKSDLIKFRNANSAGVKAFNFTLTDVSGNKIKLDDFREKVVIIDFWFTGCVGCLQMAKSLKNIIPDFKSHPNIAFVSVCVDGLKKIKEWRKTVTEEKYSSKDEINLITNEPFGESDLVKNYKISNYPALIVISKSGSILTTVPPDPRFSEKSFKDFILKNIY